MQKLKLLWNLLVRVWNSDIPPVCPMDDKECAHYDGPLCDFATCSICREVNDTEGTKYYAVLTYKNGDTIIAGSPYSIRHPESKSRPVKIRVSRDVVRHGFVWNKLLLAMDPNSDLDIDYVEEEK